MVPFDECEDWRREPAGRAAEEERLDDQEVSNYFIGEEFGHGP